MPDVSIVVTARNYGHYLSRCLSSIADQLRAPTFETVVVDDGSSDDTPEVIARHARAMPLTPLRLRGKGLAAASNAGIEATHGQWILRVDADDFLPPNALARLWRSRPSRNTAAVYGDLLIIDSNGREIGILSQAPDKLLHDVERTPTGSGCLYRRSAWRALGGYDESLRYQEDFDFWLRLTERFAAIHVPAVTYAYRQHPRSMSTNARERSIVRREVKRAAVARRGLSLRNCAVVVLAASPLLARAPVEALLHAPAGRRALNALHGAILAERRLNRRLFFAAGERLRRWAQSRGYALAGRDLPMMFDHDPVEIARRLVPKDVRYLLAIVPLYPYLHPWRVGEIVDTLLLSESARVDTALPLPLSGMVRTRKGWRMPKRKAYETGLATQLRLTGGLSIADLRYPDGPRSWLEILPAEGLSFADIVHMEGSGRATPEH